MPHWRAPADAAMSTPNHAARACSRWSRLDSSMPSSAAAIWDRRANTRTTAATTGTTTSQKTQRHDQVVVTQAAIGGPSRDGSTQAAEITLNTLGRNDSG